VTSFYRKSDGPFVQLMHIMYPGRFGLAQVAISGFYWDTNHASHDMSIAPVIMNIIHTVICSCEGYGLINLE